MAASFLAKFTVKDVLEEERDFEFVTVNEMDRLDTVLELLGKNRITSAPVFNSKKEFVGIIDMLDLVTYVSAKFSKVSLLAEESYRQMDEYASKPIKDLLGASSRNAPKCIGYESSLLTLISMLSNPHIHRVAVINEQKDLVGLVSQSKIVEFMYGKKDQLGEQLKVQVKSWLKKTDVVTIHMDRFVIEAFQTIWDEMVSGLAVVNDEGKLVSNISASDLRNTKMKPGQIIHELYQPLKQFLHIRSSTKEQIMMGDLPKHDPIFVTAEATMQEVMERVITNKIHRVYVVDSNNKPTGVISLCDIMKQFDKEAEKLKELKSV